MQLVWVELKSKLDRVTPSITQYAADGDGNAVWRTVMFSPCVETKRGTDVNVMLVNNGPTVIN
jgi:hypothetical protein